MKTRKGAGRLRRFLRRGLACLLAVGGLAMAAGTAGLPQPLAWLAGSWAVPAAQLQA